MNRATTLFEQLSPAEVDWILSTGTERQIAAGETIIKIGEPVTALVIVLEGLLGVFAENGERLAVLGPGELVGEMSLVENRLPTTSITALETTLTLVLPFNLLEERLSGTPAFAARFFCGIAGLLSQRLRAANNLLAADRVTEHGKLPDDETWRRVSEAVASFKDQYHKADALAIKNFGELPEATAQELVQGLHSFIEFLNQQIGDAATVNQRVKEEVGAYVQKEMLPYIALTENAERMYSKPRGYAGDFLTIAKMYQNIPGGSGRLGPTIDKGFLNAPPAVAVRNRRGILAQEIDRTIKDAVGAPARITSLACGPAAEIFDIFQTLEHPGGLKATLIDIDMQALAYVAERRDRLKLQHAMTLLNENLIYLALGRAKSSLKDQDLVYSIGLIDYFNDELVIRLLNWIHSILKPGGRVILGNFHPRNDWKALMDHVLDWRLIHRTEEDMNRIYEGSAFHRPCTQIRFEEQGINLFAECVKVS